MLVYLALPHRLAGGPALLGRIEPVLTKRISPLSCGARPSAFSSSPKCAFWRPGSFGDVVLTFHCQLPFFFRCRKSQLLSVKLSLAQCGLSLAPVLLQFSRCPRIHLLKFITLSYRNEYSPQLALALELSSRSLRIASNKGAFRIPNPRMPMRSNTGRAAAGTQSCSASCSVDTKKKNKRSDRAFS